MPPVPTAELVDRFFDFAAAVASRTATTFDDEAVKAAHMLAKIPTIQEFVDDLLDTTIGPDTPDDVLQSVVLPTAVLQAAGAAGFTAEKFLTLLPLLLELFRQIRTLRNSQ